MNLYGSEETFGRYGKTTEKRWSAKVTETSHALALEPDVFKMRNPK